MRWIEEAFPYMLEAEVTKGSLPPQAVEVACRRTMDGKISLLLRPEERLDVLRLASRVQRDDAVQCVLLALPETPVNVSRMDLRRWAEEAERRAGRPVRLMACQGRYRCGEEACCQCHAQHQVREEREEFGKLLGRTHSVDGAIDGAFAGLSVRDRKLLRRWATQEDPSQAGQPIRLRVLAEEVGVSVRQVSRVLQVARAENPEVYDKLAYFRSFRFHKTGAYEVRG